MFVKLMFLLVLKDEAEQCIGTGRFPIPNTNCSDYVVCTVFKNKLIGHIASCPDGTRFNPRSRLCSFGYACTDSVCQAADIEEGQSYLDPNDRNNGTYITCDFNEIYGTLTASYRSCPSHSVFQVSNASQYNRGMCLTNGNVYVGDIKDDASKFTENILFDQYNAQNCTAIGRYPVYGTACKYYVHCTVSGGTFYATTFHCPDASFFNPRSETCVRNYICGDTFCQTAMNATRANVMEFLDPNTSNNVSYIQCVRYNNTAVTPIFLNCVGRFIVFSNSSNINKQGCCSTTSCKLL